VSANEAIRIRCFMKFPFVYKNGDFNYGRRGMNRT
jgi:hypothetical protein